MIGRPVGFRAVVLALIFVLASPSVPLAQERIPVVATFSILADLVREVGGERVEVRSLLGPDMDMHGYQPTPADGRALASAKLVVANGLGFEGWIDRLVRSSGYKGPVVTATTGVTPLAAERRHAHGHGEAERQQRRTGRPVPDPHAWQDVRNVLLYVGNIAEGLAKIAPADADIFRGNATRYSERLRSLDAEIRQGMAIIVPEKRRAITSHDAFAYFGTAYGVTFSAASGVSSEAQPSARAMAALITQIKREGTKAIFLENLGDPRLLQQLARDAGAVVGGKLYSDALSAPGGPAGTFEQMMRHNAVTLIEAMKAN